MPSCYRCLRPLTTAGSTRTPGASHQGDACRECYESLLVRCNGLVRELHEATARLDSAHVMIGRMQHNAQQALVRLGHAANAADPVLALCDLIIAVSKEGTP